MTDRTTTVTLDHPVKYQGRTITTLTCRRPLVRDLIAAERQTGDIAREAALLARCADIDFAAVSLMDAADYHRAALAAGIGFFGEPPSTGGASSSSSIAGPDGGSTSS